MFPHIQVVIFSFTIICYTELITAVDIDSVKEGECIRPKVDDRFSLSSVLSKDWYFVYWSKYGLYRKTAALSDTPEDQLTDYNVDRSCQSIKLFENSGSVVTGFGGKRRLLMDYSSNEPGILEWIFRKPDGSLGARGKSYVTYISYDKSLFVLVKCWEDQAQKSYAVLSTQPNLDTSIKTVIQDHIASMGFNLRYFQEMQHQDCVQLLPDQKSDRENDETAIFSPVASLFTIIQTKIEFVRTLVSTFVRLLTAPFQFINQTLANFRLRI